MADDNGIMLPMKADTKELITVILFVVTALFGVAPVLSLLAITVGLFHVFPPIWIILLFCVPGIFFGVIWWAFLNYTRSPQP